MLHKFILPNHMTNAVRLSLNQLAKNGNPIRVNTFEIDNSLHSFDRLVLEVESHPYEIMQLGIKIGYNLAQETESP